MNRTAASPGRLVWLRERTTVVLSAFLLGVIIAVSTWFAVVSLPGLGSVVAAYAGFGATATAVTDVAVLALAVAALAGGGILEDRLLGEAAIGVGALVTGLGAVAAGLVPGPVTAVLLGLCSVAGTGLLLPALVVRAGDGHARDRPGTTLGLVGGGFLLANVVVLAGWYFTTAWLGLAATANLLSGGVVGLLPRVLVYETFGTWRAALLVMGGGLVAFAALSLLAAGSFAPDRIRSTVDRFRTVTGTAGWTFSLGAVTGTTERTTLATWLVAVAGAWTVATGLLVYDAAVSAVTAPIMALAGRLVTVPLLLGVVVGGLALDRAGLRPILGAALVGAVAGPTLYSVAAGPATETVALLPAGWPWLLVALLLTGLGIGAVLVGLFVLPLSMLDPGSARTGPAAGFVLAVGLTTALVARTIVPVDGRASPLVLVSLAAPALAGLLALRSLGDLQPAPDENSSTTDSTSSDTG